ncbi:hypothetical protein JW960_26725 [candidate division KSB1 bacterium]|nr:hypothetical protein [candidate division KSB1 bacterium]
MNDVTLKIPKKALYEFLQQLPYDEIENVLNEIKDKHSSLIKLNRMQSLESLNDIISIGGDALQDTEKLYE